MAKLTLTIDTEANTAEVAVNGKAVADACDVSAYYCPVDPYDDDGDYRWHFRIGCQSEEDGIRVRTDVMARKDPQAAFASHLPASKLGTDLVEVRGLTKAQQALAQFFSR